MKALILDMDGVIVDSEPIHFAADLEILASIGSPVDHEYLEKYVGSTNPQMWKEIIVDLHLQHSVDQLIQMQMDWKLSFIRNNDLIAIDGIPDLLEQAKHAGLKIGLASSSPLVFIEAIITKLGLKTYFHEYMSAEQAARSKPEPDVYLDVAKKLGVDPRDAIGIEDSRSGVAAAKAAGMFCYGYLNPNSGQQDLSAADVIIERINQVELSCFCNQ